MTYKPMLGDQSCNFLRLTLLRGQEGALVWEVDDEEEDEDAEGKGARERSMEVHDKRRVPGTPQGLLRNLHDTEEEEDPPV